jgi:diguanylate cyclase (GGDEF)-like protein
MGITDRHGNALVKSLVANPIGMNYSERDYFRYLSTHDTRDVFIGAPVRSKVDGSLNVTISRRINNADGSFAGIVVSSVSMDFFRKLFESVQAKSGGVIGLVADDGTVLARSADSFGQRELGALLQAPPGALDYVSAGEVRRVGSYSRLSSYPMVALVARDSDDILREWYAEMRTQGAVVLCTLLVIAYLGYRLDQTNRETRRQALRDTLTGLPNRRCLEQAVAAEFRRAARRGEPLSFIMADIDLFKPFNDAYGHPAGDACLRAVATALAGVLRRPGDMAARLGGEEIGVLLPATDAAGAASVAQAVQKAILSLGIRHEGSPYGVVTLSLGVACCRPADATTTWQALAETADRALYEAKAQGRNAVVIDDGPPLAPSAAPENEARVTERRGTAVS